MKSQVKELCLKGHTTSQIAVLLNVAKSTVSHHKRTLGLVSKSKIDPQTWNIVQQKLSENVSYKNISKLLGISSSAVRSAVFRGRITRSKVLPKEASVEQYCESYNNVKSSSGFRKYVKDRMIEETKWKYECSSCLLTEWQGYPIPLQLDHIDGNPKHNLINNLRLLCCNCHYLTDTWGNKKRK